METLPHHPRTVVEAHRATLTTDDQRTTFARVVALVTRSFATPGVVRTDPFSPPR
jgi:hypothetical protein